jgi:hypothetical protein
VPSSALSSGIRTVTPIPGVPNPTPSSRALSEMIASLSSVLQAQSYDTSSLRSAESALRASASARVAASTTPQTATSSPTSSSTSTSTPSSAPSNPSSPSAGLIVGAVIGSIAALALVGIFVLLYLRHRKPLPRRLHRQERNPAKSKEGRSNHKRPNTHTTRRINRNWRPMRTRGNCLRRRNRKQGRGRGNCLAVIRDWGRIAIGQSDEMKR